MEGSLARPGRVALLAALAAGGLAASGCGSPGGEMRAGRSHDLLLDYPASVELPPGGGTSATGRIIAGDVARSCLLLRPPAGRRFTLDLAPGARLVTEVALEEHAREGVRLYVEASHHGAARPARVWERTLDPRREADRRWQPVDVDLGGLGVGRVELVLGAELPPGRVAVSVAGGRVVPDGAGFAVPRVVSAGTSRPRPAFAEGSVVLLSLDTLRVEELGSHGGEGGLSPGLDRLSRQGALYPDAIAASHYTLPSHASIMSGTHADVHAVAPGRPLPASVPTLAEVLAARGVRTLGFGAACPWLSPTFGFDRGFRRYLLTDDRAAERIARVREALEAPEGGRLFLFVHLYDAHNEDGAIPYVASEASLRLAGAVLEEQPRCDAPRCIGPELLGAALAGRRYSAGREAAMRAGYRAGLVDLDLEVTRLVRELAAVGLLDRALLAVTSDHGEEHADHGRYLHTQLYPETTQALLLLRTPGERGSLRDGMPGHVDLAPTIVAHAEAGDAPPAWQGERLGERAPRRGYGAGVGTAVLRDEEGTVLALPDGRLVAFDRAADPGEQVPLPVDGSSVLASELAARRARHARLAEDLASAVRVEPTEEEQEQLRSLGYVP